MMKISPCPKECPYRNLKYHHDTGGDAYCFRGNKGSCIPFSEYLEKEEEKLGRNKDTSN